MSDQELLTYFATGNARYICRKCGKTYRHKETAILHIYGCLKSI